MIAYLLTVIIICAIAFTLAYMAPMQTKVVQITGVQVQLPKNAKTAADANVTAKAISRVVSTYNLYDSLLTKIRTLQDWSDHCKDISYLLTLNQGATLNVGKVALNALESEVNIVLTSIDDMIIRMYIVPGAGKLHATGTNIKYNTGSTNIAGYIECPAVAPRIYNAQLSFGRGIRRVF